MQKWIISANGKLYNHAASFDKNGHIDWRQNHIKFEIGDIVYIYSTRPLKKVMFKAIVEKISMEFSECTDDKEFWKDLSEYEKAKTGKYFRLKLLEQTDRKELSLDNLKKNGLKAAPQGPQRIDENLADYLDKYFKLEPSEGVFAESDIPENYYEGAVKTTTVNKYERNIEARKKCIEYHGCECSICGLSFEEMYGELGKDFIHVHHIIPLNTIGKEYKVNYKNDLIPVCPNCHAMLHRKLNGKYYAADELKTLVNNNKKA